ncbi:protein FAR1-RELATED SEQUENCE 5-like [Lotus japonicus]|uniref:protein FAR1-RELATED SEQUENCE 5-like n=1 Tax=Lotus japonicus TaxID=34305 RepID=UPI002584A43F|nr:protein FAR1-RELATED SEQUENCE 5-like [Lotus japonicus]
MDRAGRLAKHVSVAFFSIPGNIFHFSCLDAPLINILVLKIERCSRGSVVLSYESKTRVMRLLRIVIAVRASEKGWNIVTVVLACPGSVGGALPSRPSGLASLAYVAAVGSSTRSWIQEDWKPKVGMVFDSVEEAWKFWVEYGRRVGFGVRKQYVHNNKDGYPTSSRFVCCKEGLRRPDKRDYKTTHPRSETRTNCEARLGLKSMCEKLIVHDFVEEHNHIFHLQETTHMLPCNRKVSEVQCYQIDFADDACLQQRKSFELMSKQVGGRTNLGYTRLDQKNYLRKRRQRSWVDGEAGYILQYFQSKLVENPTFYHAYQLDVEDQVTNVFWVDARMLIDYEYFGDVVSLDSTYCTNNSHRPLAVFSGFNHHRKAIIFGAALLYDETTESYKWLFETFLEAHKQKKPQTVFTDQDQAMGKALVEVLPETFHGLCTHGT